MASIISGNSLGLTNNPISPRGGANVGVPGQGDQVYVNSFTGNLVIQQQDEYISTVGPDISILRTYNSLGTVDGDNNDNWRLGFNRSLRSLPVAINTAGSTITKVYGDGTETVFAYDTARGLYVSTASDEGARDTLTSTSDGQWTWTDGTPNVQEIYTASGQLQFVRDADNNITRFFFDSSGMLNQITSATGEYTFIDRGGTNVAAVRVSTPDGVQQTLTRYLYDGSNRLQQVLVDLTPAQNSIVLQDNNGDGLFDTVNGQTYVTTYTYDGASKRIASIAQGDGSRISFTYEQQPGTGLYRVKTYTDGEGKTTTFSYVSATQTDVLDPLGLTTSYFTDAQGRITEVRSPGLGGSSGPRLSTFYQYDGVGNLTQITDGDGNPTIYTPDANGNITLIRDAQGNTVTRTYNNSTNQILAETTIVAPDPDGSGPQLATTTTTRYVYDGENHLRFAITGEGRVTEYRYDVPGNRTSAIAYTGGVYNVAGLSPNTTFSDSQLQTWVGTQDKTRTARTDYAYDFRGNLSGATTYAQTDTTGAGVTGTASITHFIYDQRGQLLQTIDARSSGVTPNAANPNLANATTYLYDGLGRVVSTTQWVENASTRTTQTAYDDANRKTTITLANGLVTTSTYDKRGLLLNVVQTANNIATGTTTYQYDADGRLRVVTDPANNKTHTLYDEANRAVATIDATGVLSESVYDSAGNILKQIKYANRLTTAQFASLLDASGNPATVTLASVRPALSNDLNNGDRVTYNFYDKANRLVIALDPVDTDLTRDYLTQYLYDGAGRVTDVIRYSGSIVLPASPTLANVTPLIQANSLSDRQTRNFYDADGNLVGTLDGEGAVVERKYDAGGRLVETIAYAKVVTVMTAATPPTVDVNATKNLCVTAALATLRQNIVNQDPNGVDDQHTYIFYNGNGQVSAQLDAENYLTEYGYDAVGNRTQQTRYYTKAAAYTGTKPAAPAPNADDQVVVTVYNGANQVSQVTTNPTGTVTKYAYDNVGNLIRIDSALNATDVRTTRARYDAKGRVLQQLTGEGSAALDALLAQTPAPTQAQIDTLWSQYSLTHAYDLAGRRISSVDQNGNKTLFYYDTDNRLTHAVRVVDAVNALGEVTETQYNAFGQVQDTIRYGTRISTVGLKGGASANIAPVVNAALDSHEQVNYTVRGQVKRAIDALGNATSYSYNAFRDLSNRVTPVMVVSGASTLSNIYNYDRRGLQTVVRALGFPTQRVNQYDAFGRVTAVTDANGVVQTHSYDRLGRQVTATIDPLTVNPAGLNLASNTTYDALARVLTQTDARGNTTTYAYNDTARSLSITMPEGIVATRVMNHHGDVISVTDGNSSTTTYDYDKDGNLKGVTQPTGSGNRTMAYTYDRADRKILARDGNGVYTRFDYDAANRVLTRTVDPTNIVAAGDNPSGLNLVTQYVYDPKGQAILVTDPNGVVTQNNYDLKGEVLNIIVDAAAGGLKITTTYSHDPSGRTLTVTEGAGTPEATAIQYNYDKLGRLLQKIKDPSGLNLICTYTYDNNGNVTSKTEGSGAETQVTRYVYDHANRLIYAVDAMGGVVKNDYDQNGNVIAVTRYANAMDLVGLGTTIAATDIQSASRLTVDSTRDAVMRTVYDKDGRAVFTIGALWNVAQNIYDANGNVLEHIAYAAPIPSTTALTVNGVTAAVNALPNSSANESARTVYDLLNRAIYTIDALGFVTRRYYDGNDHVIRAAMYAAPITLAGEPTLTAVASAVAAVANPSTDRVVNAVYDSANRLIYQIDALNYVTETRYDGVGRVLKTLRYANAAPAPAWWSQASTAAAVAGILDATRDQVTQYLYDRAGRLTSMTDADGRVEYYRYNSVGNKIEFTNKKGASQGDAAYTWKYEYDKAGRLIKEMTPPVTVTRIVENADGSVTPLSIGPASFVTLIAYDSVGNVKARTEASGTGDERTTTYVYDLAGRQIQTLFPAVKVYDPAADQAANYLDRREIAQTPTSATYYNALGQAIASRDVRGNYSYKIYDRLGRVAYEIDPERFVVAYTYDGFGNQLTLTRYAIALDDSRLSSILNPADPLRTFSARESAAAAGNSIHEFTTADLAALVANISSGGSRTQTSVYDQLNRAFEVRQPEVDNYDFTNVATLSAADSGQYFRASPTTRYVYNAFGQVVKQSILRTFGVDNLFNSTDDQWIDTYYYYNSRGEKRAQVDGKGYLTTYFHDAEGNLTRQTEYSQLLNFTTSPTEGANQYNTADYSPTPHPGDPNVAAPSVGFDRTTAYTYDRLNRKLTETKVGVQYTDASYGGIVSVASRVGDLTTTFAYDAVGNLVSVKDPTQATTYTYYDTFGRISAVAEPARSNVVTGDSTQKIPLTLFYRDAFGNVSHQDVLANGAASASLTGFSIFGFDVANDQVNDTVYDAHGHAVRTIDAEGKSTYNSYDIAGNLAKQWHTLTDAEGKTQQVTQLFKYDRLGHQIETSTAVSPAAIVVPSTLTVTDFTVDTSGLTTGSRATFDANHKPTGTNTLSISWSSLTPFGGSADVQATLYYTGDDGSGPRPTSRPANYIYESDTATSSPGPLGGTINLPAGHTAMFSWSGEVITSIGRVVLTKTIGDQTIVLFDSSAATQPYSRVLYWQVAAPVADFAATLTYRPSGGGAAVTLGTGSASFSRAGSVYFAKLVGLSSGAAYDYEIDYKLPDAARAYARAGGVFQNSAGWTGATAGATPFAPAFDAKQAHYNAFGEIDKKGVNGIWYEFFEYDAAGRLWRTNQDDGAYRVMLYNLQGKATAHIQSATGDLRSLAGAAGVTSFTAPVERTDTVYDVLGRAVQEIKSSFTSTLTSDPIVATPTVAVLTVSAPVLSKSGGVNSASITWSPLDAWGGTDGVSATLYYFAGDGSVKSLGQTAFTTSTIPGGLGIPGPINGASFQWTEAGVTGIKNVVVTKKIGGQVQVIYDSSVPNQAYSRVLSWKMPVPDTDVVFTYAPTGSQSQTGGTILLTGSTAIFDLAALPVSSNTTYTYNVQYRRRRDNAPYQSATGTFQNTVSGGDQVAMSAAPITSSSAAPIKVFQTLDRWGNVLSTRDPRSLTNITNLVWTTNYGYDYSNHLIQQIAPATDVWTETGADLRADTITTNDRPTANFYYDAGGRLVASTDPTTTPGVNDHVNGKRYDEADQLIGEYHADAGLVKYTYDALGRKISMADPDANSTVPGSHTTTYRYDRNNRLIEQAMPVGLNVFGSPAQNILRYTYNEDGNRLTSTATGPADTDKVETTSYFYDADGNVLLTRLPEANAGAFTVDTYDAFGHKLSEVNGLNDYQTWTYDYFGHLTSTRDLGGGLTTYTYDNAGHLILQKRSGGVSPGQNLSYEYFADGTLKRIADNTLHQETTYEYDAAGNRVHERFATFDLGSHGVFMYQDTRLFYDELNRLSGFHDGTTDTRYFYDAAGNRRRMFSSTADLSQPIQDYWYTYDSMNRMLISKGTLGINGVSMDFVFSFGTAGNLKGSAFSYDAAGNRAGATFYDGAARTEEMYTYDGLNRLYQVSRKINGSMVVKSARIYDIAGRVKTYTLYKDSGDVSERRDFSYNKNGWLLVQSNYKGNASSPFLTITYNDYDEVGNVLKYTVRNTSSSPYTLVYSYDPYVKLSSYRESTVTGKLTSDAGPSGGTATSSYDVNGNLWEFFDSRGKRNQKTRDFVTNSMGQIIRKYVGSDTQTYYYAGAQQVGSAGNLEEDVFDYNYTPISENYPANSPTSYIVNENDTLQSISLAVYGDASLWFLIADANGIQSADDLSDWVGQTITIPNRITSVHNNASTFKVYNPKEIIGDTLPTIPPPPPPKHDHGCGVLGQIIVILVTIVVSYLTAGALTGLITALAADVIGAVAGSVAGQLTGIALGVQNKFSWGAVAASALGAVAGAALGAAAKGLSTVANVSSDLGNFAVSVAKSMVGNALTQGINILTGQQKQFNWLGVAAAGVGSTVSGYLGGKLGLSADPQASRQFDVGEVIERTGVGIVSGAIVQAISNRGKIDWVSVAADSFGNALGNAIVGEMKFAGFDAKLAALGSSIVGRKPESALKYDPTAAELRAYESTTQRFGFRLGLTHPDADVQPPDDPQSPSNLGQEPVKAGLRYAYEFSEAFDKRIINAAEQAGHFDMPGLIGLMAQDLNISDDRVRTMMYRSQMLDQLSLTDATINGFRFESTDDTYGPGQAGVLVERVGHAFTGKPMTANLSFIQGFIFANRNDEAATDVAMHPLVDAIYHSFWEGNTRVGDDAPFGHVTRWHQPDYISDENGLKFDLSVGQLMSAIETISGNKFTEDQRGRIYDYAGGLLATAEAKAGTGLNHDARTEMYFRELAGADLESRLGVPLLKPAGVNTVFTVGEMIRGVQITPERTHEEAAKFLAGSGYDPDPFTNEELRGLDLMIKAYIKENPNTVGASSYRTINDLNDTKEWSVMGIMSPYRLLEK